MNRLLCVAIFSFLSLPSFAEEDHATGLVKPENWAEGQTFVDPAPVVLPGKWDWREKTAGFMPVHQQGRCGSCWAEGSSAVMEAAVLIADKKVPNFSVQQLVSCNDQGYSCNGGYFVHDMQKSGVNYTKDYPYTASDSYCRSSVAKHEKIAAWAFVGGSQEVPPSVEQLKQAIYQYGPVAVTVTSDSAMQRYKGWKFFDGKAWGPTNHIVTIVGWNDVDALDGQKGYWIMRNSWGSSWGAGGYMAIKYGASRIGEEATFVVYKPSCVDQPKLPANTVFNISAGEEVQLTVDQVPGHSYSWRDESSWFGAIGPSYTVAPKENTSYRLTQKTSCGSYTTVFKVNVH